MPYRTFLLLFFFTPGALAGQVTLNWAPSKDPKVTYYRVYIAHTDHYKTLDDYGNGRASIKAPGTQATLAATPGRHRAVVLGQNFPGPCPVRPNGWKEGPLFCTAPGRTIYFTVPEKKIPKANVTRHKRLDWTEHPAVKDIHIEAIEP